MDSPQTALAVKILAIKHDCIAVATGPTDYVSDGKDVYALKRGHEWLTLLSGSGCYVGTMMAAYMSVAEPLIAAMTALALMGVASEVAAMKSDGPGTFRAHLFDVLHDFSLDLSSFDMPRWEKLEI